MFDEHCDYCERDNVKLGVTPEVGPYCIDCLRLARDNLNREIRIMKAAGVKPRPKTLEYEKIRADAALEKLMNIGGVKP